MPLTSTSSTLAPWRTSRAAVRLVALEQRQGESRPVVAAPSPDLGSSFEQSLDHRQVALG